MERVWKGYLENVLITGLGWVVPGALRAVMDGTADAAVAQASSLHERGRQDACATTAPEITGFETPAGAPAFGFEIPEFRLEDYLPHIKTYMDRTSALALAAARVAMADAGLLDRAARPAGVEVGCAYGTTLGCLEAMGIFWKKVKSSNPKFAPPLPFTHGYTNSPSSLLCIEYGLKGSAATFSGEWLAGMEALLFAVDQIATGSAEVVLVGASESLTRAAHAHLFAAGMLSRTGRLAAWGEHNDGVVPGEGAAFLVLESAASAAARGCPAYAQLAGVGLGAATNAQDHRTAWTSAAEAALREAGPLRGPTLVAAATPAASRFDRAERAAWRRILAGDTVSQASSLHERGRQDACATPMPATVVTPKLLTGELLSVSPLLGAALAALVLTGRLDANRLPAAPLPSGERPSAEPLVEACLGALDPGGAAGVAVLRRGTAVVSG